MRAKAMLVLTLLLSACTADITQTVIKDDGSGGGGGGSGGGGTTPSCPSTIDYAPRGGTIRVGQSIQLTVQNWPANTNCQPFWYLNSPSIAQIAGADNIIMINGTPFYAGINAVLRGVSPGTVTEVCVQTSIQTPVVKRCWLWIVTGASSTIFFDNHQPHPFLRYMDVEGVSQTYNPLSYNPLLQQEYENPFQ